MALKIFVSSVYRELTKERLALGDEIQRLQDLFVGMELFGSDPKKPGDYVVQKAEESDLYVGLFGDEYGSIDPTTGISFTQLEYEAAVSKHIPCLIYFKASSSGPPTNAQLAALKERLRRDHIISEFTDSYDLKVRFLRDFIKLLQEALFDKIIPTKRGVIPAGVLLSLTQQSIEEQVKSVGQDKYISELYVTREAEKEIARFTHYESVLGARATTIFRSLETIRDEYGLGDNATKAISNAQIALKDVRESILLEAIEELKRAFYFQEVEEALDSINSVILETSDYRFDVRLDDLRRQWEEKPFISQERLRQADIHHERYRSSIAHRLETSLTYQDVLQIFPSERHEKRTDLANDLLKELYRLVQLGLKRCLVLVDRAGTGKTNIVCHLAEQLSEDQPVVLLSGHMELSSEYDIEAHVERQLEATLSGIFTDWMPRVSPGLQKAGKWLFIIIDGINENTKRPLFIQLLKGLLPKLKNKRIKVILTCRDLFWDVFRDTIEPHLFGSVIALPRFSEVEWHEAIKTYFQEFDIKCSLSKEAQEALRDPLLLRFFCEANRGGRLGRVNNLRLLSVFNLYVKRVGLSISERHGTLRPEAMLKLLLKVANRMWEQRAVAIDLDSIDTEQTPAGGDSLYDMVLSENIILEESTHLYSTRKVVRFLYDEFMEYVIARSWVDRISSAVDQSAAISRLVQDAAQALAVFPSALGSVLFLDKMLDRGGRLINDLVVRMSTQDELVLTSQQTSLIYALESADFAHADDQLMAVVEKFELVVRQDLRERLAAVILKILEARPDQEYARKYVHRLLEVEEKRDVTKIPNVRLTGKPFYDPSKPWIPPKAEKIDPPRPGLPPVRYHYTEDTKINAIGILVQLKDKGDYDVIDDGIRKLGRSDLHSALQAWQYLDLATDELVYKTIGNYLNAHQPEYRIYCAWLLRERYGSEPALFFTILLTDAETRVHRYTANLFEKRLIERELIEAILRRIESDRGGLKPWHLINFIRILGKRQQFHPPVVAEALGAKIVATLSSLLNHHQGSLRLEVYRSMMANPSFINLREVKEKMQQDSDFYIRSLTEKM